MYKVLLVYLRKRRDKYNWILKRASRLNEKNCFFFWWGKDTEFSNTPLRSFHKRMGDREVLLTKNYEGPPLTISRKKRSCDIVDVLPDGFLASSESHMCEDLSTFLLGMLRESVEDRGISDDTVLPESVEVMEEGSSTDRRIELIMKALVHLLRKVEQLPTDMIDLLGGRATSVDDNLLPADPYPRSTYPYQQIPPQIPPTGGYLQMF